MELPQLAQRSEILTGVQAGVRGLFPGYFALVMATGIVSTALLADGTTGLSVALLILAIICYLVLLTAYGWRITSYRAEFLADATSPVLAFSLFTFVAGSDVLGARLASAGYVAVTEILLVLAGAAWLLLSYGTPLVLITRHGDQSALAGINGGWFLWAVGTQSIAVSVTSLAAPLPSGLAVLAVVMWSVGVVLYLILATLVLAGLLHFPVQPARLTPAYWVFMGATAISVLAGAKLLELPASPLLAEMHPVVAGLSFILWAFGSWLVPLLVGLGVWRHLIRRFPLRYDPGLWSMSFPLGMYCVASETLGQAVHVPWLVSVGHDGTWVAFAVWVLLFAAMLAALASRFYSSTPT
ncbi:MAG TPA: tellurite resistance/C4-dicarboxylate transporter family protein [Streptosporangiaceae bacterium]